MLKIEEIYIINLLEYEVCYYNEKNKTFSIRLLNDNEKINLKLKQNIKINNEIYKILYINEGKKRITIKKLEENNESSQGN
jgi:hypothetical protein